MDEIFQPDPEWQKRVQEEQEARDKAWAEADKEATVSRLAKMKKEEEALFAADIPARFVEGEGYVDASVHLTIENKQVITLAEADELLRNRFNNGN